MQEKGQLEKVLKAWTPPLPRADFEASVLCRLHASPVRESFRQRWFIEPWQYASAIWRTQAIVIAGLAALALILALGLNLKRSNASSTDFGLDAFSTFPSGSFTQSYLEMVKQ